MNFRPAILLLFFGTLFAAFSSSLIAQEKGESVIQIRQSTYEEDEDTLRSTGIGVSFGVLGANGFSFRQLPEKGSGYQLGGIYLLSADKSYFKLSALYLYILSRTRLTCFYLLGGLSYKWTRHKEDALDSAGLKIGENWKVTTSRWAYGAGFGVATRRLMHERVWLSVEIPITYFKGQLLPWPTASLHYLLW